MTTGKNRRRHRCKNHPARTARGRCSRCGRWVCSECAVIEQGSFFCADTCLEPVAVQNSSTPPPPHEQPAHPGRPRRTLPVAVTSLAAVIALTSLGAALWGIHETQRLTGENRILLKHDRLVVDKVNRLNDKVWKLGALLEHLSDSLAAPAPKSGRKTPHLEPSQRQPGGPLPLSFDNGTLSKKLVCLTFDGGGEANITNEILDTLKSRSVKATMFLTGNFIRAFPRVVQRIVAEGHEVGNHTAHHPHLTTWEQTHSHATREGLTADILRAELDGANQKFLHLTGHQMSRLWRAPYGEKNNTICAWAQAAGYLHVGWRQGRTWIDNLDTNDWVPDRDTPGYKTPGDVYDKIMAHAHSQPYGLNGGIILMHLGTKRKNRDEQVHLILGSLIDTLRAMGYEFMTVGAIAAQSGVKLDRLPARTSAVAQGETHVQ